MDLRARPAGDAEQADQLAALAFQIRPDGQAAARAALASGLAGFPDRDPRDRFLLHRSQSAHAAVVERAYRVQRGAGRQRRAHAPAALPPVPEKSARALRAAARQVRSVPARAQRNRHGGWRRADRPDRAAVEERRPHHSVRPQPPRRRQRRRVRPQRHVPGLPLHPLQRGADRNPFRAVERVSAVGPQRHVQAAAADEPDAVADRAVDRGLRRLPAVVLVHRQHGCVAVDAARRRTRPPVELRHAADRRCARDRHRAGLLALGSRAREARGSGENGERHAARRHQGDARAAVQSLPRIARYDRADLARPDDQPGLVRRSAPADVPAGALQIRRQDAVRAPQCRRGRLRRRFRHPRRAPGGAGRHRLRFRPAVHPGYPRPPRRALAAQGRGPRHRRRAPAAQARSAVQPRRHRAHRAA